MINALVLGTIDGDAVRAQFARQGIPLFGHPEEITTRAFDRPDTIDTAQMSNILENLSSIRLARAGWGPTQSPSAALRASVPDPSKEPDLYLNLTGKVADIISTGSTSTSPAAALSRAMEKVQSGQTQHVVMNLDRSPWEVQDLVDAFSNQQIVLEGSTYSSLEQAIAAGLPGTFPSNLANGSSFPVLLIDVIRGNELVQLYP